MGLAFVSYLIFNVLAGPVLTIQYFRVEQRVKSTLEFCALVLFPAVGLGVWRYNQQIRKGSIPEFEQSWFIWKFMIRFNWAYLIALGVAVIFLLLSAAGVPILGMEIAEGDEYGFATMFGMIATLGLGILFLLFAIVILFSYALLIGIMILIPKYLMKSEEAKTYKLKSS